MFSFFLNFCAFLLPTYWSALLLHCSRQSTHSFVCCCKFTTFSCCCQYDVCAISSHIRRFIYHMFACLPRIVWLHLLRCTFRRRSHLYHFRLVLVSWRFTKIPSTEIGYGSSLLSIFAFLSFLPPRSCGIQSIWRVLAFNYCPYIPRTLLLWLYFFISTRHTKLKGNCYLVGCSYLLLKWTRYIVLLIGCLSLWPQWVYQFFATRIG